MDILRVPHLDTKIKAVAFTKAEHYHPLYDEYLEIRDQLYIMKHWESDDRSDKYDCHSVAILVVESGKVMAGSRIIFDSIGLPIREFLCEHGLPTEQVPFGSCEVSRFALRKDLIGRKESTQYLTYMVQAITVYGQLHQIDTAYAVLVSILEKWFIKIGVAIERLPQHAVIEHGDQYFYTVKFDTKRTAEALFPDVYQSAA